MKVPPYEPSSETWPLFQKNFLYEELLNHRTCLTPSRIFIFSHPQHKKETKLKFHRVEKSPALNRGPLTPWSINRLLSSRTLKVVIHACGAFVTALPLVDEGMLPVDDLRTRYFGNITDAATQIY